MLSVSQLRGPCPYQQDVIRNGRIRFFHELGGFSKSWFSFSDVGAPKKIWEMSNVARVLGGGLDPGCPPSWADFGRNGWFHPLQGGRRSCLGVLGEKKGFSKKKKKPVCQRWCVAERRCLVLFSRGLVQFFSKGHMAVW